ncbi:MAG TPA: 50S ribosomal protein L9 [Blastocatellia bacterium]|nr:50S ribosomal protein L9 [Blastocatellia bacterium]
MAHMDVLLCEDVDNLGERGQVVRVRAGYGRNYLLPQKMAIEATTGNKRLIEEQQRVLAKRENREKASAQGEASNLEGLELVFERRVGEHGILFGSVTALDVAEALKEKGYTVERRRIGLRDHIKEVGEYDVVIKLHRDVTPTVKVKVFKEGGAREASETAPEADSSATAETAAAESETQAIGLEAEPERSDAESGAASE